VTTAGAAYCWGANLSGIGFFGGQPPSATPVAVAGSPPFATLSTGFGSHRCGVTSGGTVYCWGVNINGELGDGTATNSAVPVKVLGQ
jgi:alpha-tubulin suppressor-like RCC1 family protein